MPDLKEHIKVYARYPDKAAKIIAKTFYRELRKYGFSHQQIILVADEIIGNLVDSLKGYKKKIVLEKRTHNSSISKIDS